MIERHHLNILYTVRKNSSLSAAAEELCLTQSAISHSIKKLEQQLGVKLWTLSGRTIKFTEEGLYLLDFAAKTLPQFTHIEKEMQAFKEGEKGLLRIGMECHPCYRWFIKAVRHYMKSWPQIDLDVKQKFQFGGMTALLQREADLIITPDPQFMDEISFHDILDYEMVLVMAEDHALSGKSYITPEDLAQEILFTYPVPQTRLDIYTQFFIPNSVMPLAQKTVESTDVMLELVIAGRGVTAMPSWLVDDFISDNMPIAKAKIGKKGIHKKLWVAVRNEEQKPYIDGFIEIAKNYK